MHPERQLPITDPDVEAMIRLLGNIVGSMLPLPQRRRLLMEQLVELVHGDTWMWVCSRHDGKMGNAVAWFLLDGGWKSDDERNKLWHANTQNDVLESISRGVDNKHHSTFLYDSSHAGWDGGVVYEKHIRPIGFAHFLFSMYPLSETSYSGVGIHRRIGREPFTDRDKAIVHLIIRQIDWLHRAGTDVEANDDILITLSPRQREILVHLLSGNSRKQISRKLDLSLHTVNDYMKDLYRKLQVQSNVELMAKFLPS